MVHILSASERKGVAKKGRAMIRLEKRFSRHDESSNTKNRLDMLKLTKIIELNLKNEKASIMKMVKCPSLLLPLLRLINYLSELTHGKIS
jgi:hypothetical protein